MFLYLVKFFFSCIESYQLSAPIEKKLLSKELFIPQFDFYIITQSILK